MAEEKLRWHKYQYLKAHKAFYCPNIDIFIMTIIISIFGVHNCNNCNSLNPQVNHLLIAVLLSMRLRKNNWEKHRKLNNHLYKKPWYKSETTGKNNFCKKFLHRQFENLLHSFSIHSSSPPTTSHR